MFPTSPHHSPLAAGATIPLSFIFAGLLAAFASTTALVVFPDTLALPHLHMHVVAFAHAWLLAALLTICFGAVYQLLPVLANTGFTGPRQAWTHLALHLTGSATMIAGFLRGDLLLVAFGGTAVSLGVALFSANILRTLRSAPRLDPILLAFAAAAAWLVLTVAAGLLLALNLRFAWWNLDVLALLRAHAHAGVAGFFVTLTQGAMFRLVPMFTLAGPPNLRRVGLALTSSQLGLLLLVSALALNLTVLSIIGTGLLLGSFLLSAIELRRILATRKKKLLEPGLRGFFAGLALLVVSALGGTALALAHDNLRAALAYGVVAILGGVLALVQGMLCKIIPFLVWMRVYGPRVGRQRTPVAAALGRPNCERLWLLAHVSGTVVLAVGTLTAHPLTLTFGSLLFGAGQLSLALSLSSAARHLWRADAPQPLPTPFNRAQPAAS